MFRHRRLLGATVALALWLPFGSPVRAQSGDATKPRLAIQTIAATDAVLQQARSTKQIGVLEQILQGADGQLIDAINRSKRFEIVAWSDLKGAIAQQDFAQSGNVDLSDPQAAKAFRIAGAKYFATVMVDNYQDVTQRDSYAGEFGRTTAERRVIQLQASVKIYDTTTAVLKESSSVKIEKAMLSELLPGAQQDGRLTNALIGDVTRLFALDAANKIMNYLSPAKVIGYTMGVITLNRGEGTGVEPGQIWEVFFPGEEMFDPDTGESYGAEEIHIGWAEIVDVQPKTTKARVIEDSGIERGAIMRPAKNGLPEGIDRNRTASGSSSSPVASGASAPRVGASAPSRGVGGAAPPAPSPDGPREAAPADTGPTILAIFIADRASEIPGEKVDVLEAYLSSLATSDEFEIISRGEVLNAVSAFSDAGANAGANDETSGLAERLLSDQASTTALAELLGAHGILMATIASIDVSDVEYNDPATKVHTLVCTTTVDVSWKILDGATGSSLAGGVAEAVDQNRVTPNLRRSAPPLDALLKDAARQIAAQAQTAMRRPKARRPSAIAANDVTVQFRVELQDMNIPEVRKIDGEWTVTSNRYALTPLACSVLVDGVFAGTAPGEIVLRAGVHKVRIERPGLEPVDRFINAKDGLKLTIPMQMSEEGRRQWLALGQYFEQMKQGSISSENRRTIAEAFATFLRNSSVTIDTSSATRIGDEFWIVP